MDFKNITIGDIGVFIAYIVALATSCKYIIDCITKGIKRALKPLEDRIASVDKNATMNFLVRCFNDLEKGETLNESTKMRLYEQYGYYTNTLKLNTYIHDNFERLKKEGKL